LLDKPIVSAGAGQYDEAAFKAFDYIIAQAGYYKFKVCSILHDSASKIGPLLATAASEMADQDEMLTFKSLNGRCAGHFCHYKQLAGSECRRRQAESTPSCILQNPDTVLPKDFVGVNRGDVQDMASIDLGSYVPEYITWAISESSPSPSCASPPPHSWVITLAKSSQTVCKLQL